MGSQHLAIKQLHLISMGRRFKSPSFQTLIKSNSAVVIAADFPNCGSLRFAAPAGSGWIAIWQVQWWSRAGNACGVWNSNDRTRGRPHTVPEVRALLGDILALQQRRLTEQQRWEKCYAMHQRPDITSDCEHIYIILIPQVYFLSMCFHLKASFPSNEIHIRAHSFIMTSPLVMAHKLGDGRQDPGGPGFKTGPLRPLHYGPL